MKPSIRRAGTFIGCAVAGSVYIGQSVNRFASVDAETAAVMSIVFILAAVIPASWISKRVDIILLFFQSRRKTIFPTHSSAAVVSLMSTKSSIADRKGTR